MCGGGGGGAARGVCLVCLEPQSRAGTTKSTEKAYPGMSANNYLGPWSPATLPTPPSFCFSFSQAGRRKQCKHLAMRAMPVIYVAGPEMLAWPHCSTGPLNGVTVRVGARWGSHWRVRQERQRRAHRRPGIAYPELRSGMNRYSRSPRAFGLPIAAICASFWEPSTRMLRLCTRDKPGREALAGLNLKPEPTCTREGNVI